MAKTSDIIPLPNIIVFLNVLNDPAVEPAEANGSTDNLLLRIFMLPPKAPAPLVELPSPL